MFIGVDLKFVVFARVNVFGLLEIAKISFRISFHIYLKYCRFYP